MKKGNPDIEQGLESLKTVCGNAGLKCTHQRMEIYKEVVRNPVHPDAETVFLKVRDRMPTISLDTVYRTLWLLRDLGLVNTLGTAYDRTRFDADLTPHHHFICQKCGKTVDFSSKELDELKFSGHGADFGGARISQVILHGVCADCAGGEKEEGNR